ncbi:hypothetical protein BOTBODRAFT_535501 [Botryobasidium botryosum FD-172 SS1]|uniref:Uncharacterized protein n=1 Tax=Botryobasidium botryosum (strain FD-172 SS1) TaxID=930990 RepID=A0A067M026_BOTB1|nr:hypothetical protein BOTBODRAFT_535501 [Botryobasidium botryosum FD-172 SS1]
MDDVAWREKAMRPAGQMGVKRQEKREKKGGMDGVEQKDGEFVRATWTHQDSTSRLRSRLTRWHARHPPSSHPPPSISPSGAAALIRILRRFYVLFCNSATSKRHLHVASA